MNYFSGNDCASSNEELERAFKDIVASERIFIPLWKAIFDKVFAVFALIFFAPLIIVVAALIYLKQGGPLFFGHKRIGQDGRLFTCFKFRTMAPDADKLLADLLENCPEAKRQWQESRKLDDDPRVTCFGRFLRKSSLDELPQFWNVLIGDMSIVGPRPITRDEAFYYGNDFAQYTSVRPGITGLWQVSGRSALNYDERVRKDVAYVKGKSLPGDLVIILKTIKVVFKGDGAC